MREELELNQRDWDEATRIHTPSLPLMFSLRARRAS
jgi:hypothetical protein